MPSEKHNHIIKSPACCKTDGLIGWCVFARKKSDVRLFVVKFQA
ncbi:hypothetical protein AB9R17_09300 [Neisseria gonorrhoeae]